MAPANSTPVPRGRLISRASPGRSPVFSQGDWGLLPFTVRVICTPRLVGSGEALRDSIVCPPISSAHCSSRTERMPARVCTSSSCCSSAETIGSVIVAMALETVAPQAQRSEQACRAVRRPLSQGSLTRAGKPSVLCRSPGCPARWAASSGCPPSPTRSSAAARGWAGNLAAQPRQAIGAASAIAACCRNPVMKARSMRCFRCQSRRDGPSRQPPQRRHSWPPQTAPRCPGAD